ncbi:hypothetical protein OLX02_18550 [Novosphingobium sp. KCTC 2891]|uniref:hypothetical protein n=1 Tax=Novosphingobium sp. KCTC 2891 TaxID=2989730 RepID=UPI0022228D41|nr:hypothetical protein [Novosphingobium sp. KCTC 2891]MCW1384821.1 hypothetical protein [Novosphingobium sp. KCTC 2891]
MIRTLAAGLVAGVSALSPAAAMAEPLTPIVHREAVAHSGGALDTTWSGQPRAVARQVGSPGSGGRPATLHCHWQIDLEIVREARGGDAQALRSTARHQAAFEVRRPGWCGSARAAFAGQGTARDDALRAHLLRHVAQDTKAVVAEADRLHETAPRVDRMES